MNSEASAVSTDISGPRGPKPKSVFTFGNIFVYSTITILALYYLAPLYVMIVTSFKSMEEIRQGNQSMSPWKRDVQCRSLCRRMKK